MKRQVKEATKYSRPWLVNAGSLIIQISIIRTLDYPNSMNDCSIRVF